MASEKNLNAVFSDIANSIRSKKGTTDAIQPINMASEIDSIETGSSEKSTIYKGLETKGNDWSFAFYAYQNSTDTSLFYYVTELNESDFPPSSNVTNMKYMFQNCSKLIKIPQLDTSNCTTMKNMFYNCYQLTTIPQLDTSKVKTMENMFYSCSSLTTIPQLNTSSCTSMANMFYYCYNLSTIPQLDTSSCTNMNSMFYYCYRKLTTIPQLNTSSCTNMNWMFFGCKELKKIDITKFADNNGGFAQGCFSLKTLIIRTMDTIPPLNSSAFYTCYHFDGTKDSTYNPSGAKDGAIYVPDDKVESLKTETNWSVFADIIKPLSEYVEE